MKKRILALICATTMVLGMSLSVCAAESATSSAKAEETQATISATLVEELTTSTTASENTTGQKITGATIAEFATTTTVSGLKGAWIDKVSNETAKALITEANSVVGKNAFVASIVDLRVPEGTGTATFTLGCPNVWKGQNVTILHQKDDGTIEAITPSAVADNAVTFTLTSYSPVAIVINTGAAGATSPKTGEVIALVAALAALCGAGAAGFGRKARA
jgi:hypothetical protein